MQADRGSRLDRPAIRVLRVLVLMSCAASLALPAGGVSAQPAPADVTTLSPLTSTGVPVPNVGQPVKMYTVAEIHQIGSEALAQRNEMENQQGELFNCYQRAYASRPNTSRMVGFEDSVSAARKVSIASSEAERMTAAAAQARIDMAAGKANQAQVEQAELDRQAAVIALLNAQAELNEARYKAIDIQNLAKDRRPLAEWESVIRTNAAERAGRKNPLVPKALEDLAFDGIRIFLRQDPKAGRVLTVTGGIKNNGTARVDIPALTLTAVDQFRYPLKVETVAMPGKIDAGKTLAFNYDFNPAPTGAASVSVAFAAVRGTPNLEPVSLDPVCQGAAPPELNPRTMGGGGGYAAANSRTQQLDDPLTTQDANGNTIRATTGGQPTTPMQRLAP